MTNKKNFIALSDSLRSARQRKKLSGTSVAEQLGISAAAYRRYERGEVVPSAQVILDMCDILDCEPTELMKNGGLLLHKADQRSVQFDLAPNQTVSITINARVVDEVARDEEAYEPHFVQPKKITKKSKRKRAS